VGFLSNKRVLIVGLASERSIAWGIAKAMHREGAEIALSYQTEKLQKRVERLGADVGSNINIPLDVASDSEIDACFATLASHWDGLDILVHSVGYAPRDQLRGGFTESITREGFQIAHDISAYSFAALAKAARPMMDNRDAALLTLSYLGAIRAIPNYNVMGPAKASLEAMVRFLASDLGPARTRVNAISAGPIKTLAAAGISGFRGMLSHAAKMSPLKRNVGIDDVGNAAAFLCSDLAAGITGEVLYVDAGYSTVGMSLD